MARMTLQQAKDYVRTYMLPGLLDNMMVKTPSSIESLVTQKAFNLMDRVNAQLEGEDRLPADENVQTAAKIVKGKGR